MKHFFVLPLACLVWLAGAQTQAGQPAGLLVEADPRIELMSVIFRLAGHPEYNLSNSRCPYTEAVDRYFENHKDHPVVKTAQELRRDSGIGYNAPMSLAVHLDGIKQLKLRVPLSPPPAGLDKRWIKSGKTDPFLQRVRGFVKSSGFANFFEKHKNTYQGFRSRLLEKIKGRNLIPWFERFYGSRPGLQTRVVLSAINGGSSYGASFKRPDGSDEVYSVVGMYKYDKSGMPVFEEGLLSLVVHEFAHSYANPVIDANLTLLEPAASKLYGLHRERMKKMAYGEWKIMAYETLVRATVQLYVRDLGRPGQAQEHLEHMRARGFDWVGELADRLDAHRKKHKKPDNLKSFIPELKKFFEDTARIELAQAEKGPKLVSMVPENLAIDVDPELSEMRFTFDRPMRDKSWSVVGGGEHFPELGKIRYSADKKTLHVPVKLKPNWSYQLWLNSSKFRNFVSAEGVPLKPVKVEFKTRAAGKDALSAYPKVVSMVPKNGAQDVDPGLSIMKITFDRPMMDRSWSVVGGGEHSLKLGKISYDKSRTVLSIPVTLKPDWSYRLWLNHSRYTNFKSAMGVPLSPVEVRFKTKKK